MGRAFQNRKESMAKTAAAKTKVYSKYGREIYVCAKAGGTDPNGNLALRGLIERAKKDQVPSHVIDKALDKASGAGAAASPKPKARSARQAASAICSTTVRFSPSPATMKKRCWKR